MSPEINLFPTLIYIHPPQIKPYKNENYYDRDNIEVTSDLFAPPAQLGCCCGGRRPGGARPGSPPASAHPAPAPRPPPPPPPPPT